MPSHNTYTDGGKSNSAGSKAVESHHKTGESEQQQDGANAILTQSSVHLSANSQVQLLASMIRKKSSQGAIANKKKGKGTGGSSCNS